MSDWKPRTNDEIYEKVANDLGLPVQLVARTYRSFWKFVKAKASEVPLKDKSYTKEEFLELRPNVNIPSIGKLNITYRRYWGKMKEKEYIEKALLRKNGENNTESKQELKDYMNKMAHEEILCDLEKTDESDKNINYKEF